LRVRLAEEPALASGSKAPFVRFDEDTSNPKDILGASKTDLSLVPPASLIHEARAMEEGAKKYGPYNWRTKKVRSRVYIAAALRHLLEYLDGYNMSDDTDPPVHHLAHAKACCGIVLDAMETGNLIDDRPVKGKASLLLKPVPVPVAREETVSEREIAKARRRHSVNEFNGRNLSPAAISNEHDGVAKELDKRPAPAMLSWPCPYCSSEMNGEDSYVQHMKHAHKMDIYAIRRKLRS